MPQRKSQWIPSSCIRWFGHVFGLVAGVIPKRCCRWWAKGHHVAETLARLDGVADVQSPVVVCNESHRFLVAEQLRQIKTASSAILLEPVGRNTAPAVAVAALAALSAAESADDPCRWCRRSRHPRWKRFRRQFRWSHAPAGQPVTGVAPSVPETGYGYIRRGDGGQYPVADLRRSPIGPSREYGSGRY
jgi:mannose-1-phosphate guanylyltransferase